MRENSDVSKSKGFMGEAFQKSVKFSSPLSIHSPNLLELVHIAGESLHSKSVHTEE